MESNSFQSLGSFESDIFSLVNTFYNGQNFCISPLSIYQVLSLTANGAKDPTLSGMLHTLVSPSLTDLNNINKGILDITKTLNSLLIANAIFTKFNPLPNFKSIAAKYQSSVQQLVNLDQVNKWCNKKTNGKIPTILTELPPLTKMILLNAVYFKGQWSKQFKKNRNREEYFRNCNKEEKEVTMMNMEDQFFYLENNEVQVIDMNYKTNFTSAMIILPKMADINEYIKNFSAEKINKIIKGLRQKKVNITLPKFEINFEIKLKTQLSCLGMSDAFSGGANFSGMKKENDIKIEEVVHKTFLQMDEEGTTAAAVTAVVMTKKMAMVRKEDKVYYMRVDHPFIFIIRNKKFPQNHGCIFMTKIETL